MGDQPNASRERMKIFGALFCVVVVSVCATSDEVNIALLDDAEQLAPEVGNPTSLIDEMDDAEKRGRLSFRKAKTKAKSATASAKDAAKAAAAKVGRGASAARASAGRAAAGARAAAAGARAGAGRAAEGARKAVSNAVFNLQQSALTNAAKAGSKLLKWKNWGTKMTRELAGAAAGLKQCKGLQAKGATLSSIAFDALKAKCPEMVAKGVKSVNDIKNYCKRKERNVFHAAVLGTCMASFNAMKNTMHLCATLASGAAKLTGQALKMGKDGLTAVSVWLDEHPRTVQFLKFGVGIGLVTAAIVLPPAGVGLAIGGTIWNLGWIIQSAVSNRRKCESQYGKGNCAMSAC